MAEHLGRTISDYETIILKALQQLPENTSAINQILAALEDMEENINIDLTEPTDLMNTIQLTCYLIQHDLENAKFFYARLQKEKKENELVGAVHQVLVYMWKGKNSHAIELVEQLQTKVKQNQALNVLISALHISLVNHTLKEIASNYTNLSINEFKSLLALKSEADTLKLIQRLNWASDEQQFLYPDSKYLMDKEKFKQINEEQITQITRLVSFLDSLQ